MNGVQKFRTHMRFRQDRLVTLEEENKKIRRQIDFFGNAYEMAKLLGDKEDEQKAQSGLTILLGRLKDNEQAIQGMNIKPYAQAALDELAERRNALEDEFHEQLVRVLRARRFLLKNSDS